MIPGQRKKKLSADRLPQLQKPRPHITSNESAGGGSLVENDVTRAASAARVSPATPQVSPQLPNRSPLSAMSGSASLSSVAQASGAALPPISTAQAPIDTPPAVPRSGVSRGTTASVVSPLLATLQGTSAQQPQQQHSAFAPAPVAPAPPKDLNSFRRTSTNKKARLSFSKQQGTAHKHLPTAVDVARISRWWLRYRMNAFLKQRRPSEFAARYVAERESQQRRTVDRAKAVIVRFLLKCARNMRSYVDDKSFLRRSRIGTTINAFLRCKQSQTIALSRYLRRVQRSYAVVLRCWRRSATYRRRAQLSADTDDLYVILAAESIERRERCRNEKLEWLCYLQQFTRAPCYQKFRSEQATSSTLSAAAATVVALAALATDDGIDEDDTANGFSFCFNAEGGAEIPLQPVKNLLSSPGRSGPAANGDAVVFSGRKKSTSALMHSSPLRNVRKSFRRSSLSLHEMNRNGSISLDVLLGASPVSRTTASSGKALLAGSRVRLPEGDVGRVDQGLGASPELVCTAGLSLFGDDASYLEQVAGSPLLLAYSKRAGAAAGDVALSDARMQMLNQQLLYPLRAGTSGTHVTLKVAVSETFLSDWCSWYATTDFQRPDTKSGEGEAQSELGRRRSAVIRKQVGGEYANAQRRLSVAATKARKLSGVSEAESYKTQIRFSARRNSEAVSRTTAVAKILVTSPLRNRNNADAVKVLSLPVGSPVFSVDLETERMLIQERTRRNRLMVQAARIIADVGERMKAERIRDLSDLLPLARRASVSAERDSMFRYGTN